MYKDYEDVYDKKKSGPSIHLLTQSILKNWKIIKIIEWNCFHFDFEHGEYISNHTLKNLERKQLQEETYTLIKHS